MDHFTDGMEYNHKEHPVWVLLLLKDIRPICRPVSPDFPDKRLFSQKQRNNGAYCSGMVINNEGKRMYNVNVP